MRHCELGIDGDGALEKRNSGSRACGEGDFPGGAIGLQRFERWSAGFFKGSRVHFNGGERFSDPCSESAGDLAEGIEDIFFLGACPCSSLKMSPVRQSFARNPNTYCAPRFAIEPSSTAALPVRSQISRASSGVSRASGGRSMRRSV